MTPLGFDVESTPDIRLVRRYSIFALVGMAIFTSIVLLLHVIRPEYDIMTRFISEYAVTDPILAAIAGVALGLGCLALAQATKSLPHPGRSKLATGLLTVFGVCAIAFGIFPADEFPTINPPSWHGIIHAISAVIGFFCFSIGSLIISWRLLRVPSVRRIAFWLISLAALCLVFFVLLYSELPIVGLVERIYAVLILAWLGLFAGTLAGGSASGPPRSSGSR